MTAPRASHLYLPSLHSGLIDSGQLPVLRAQPPEQRARLALSFGRSPAIVETTLRTGTPPALHGVLFPGEAARTPDLMAGAHTRNVAVNAEMLEQALRKALDGLADGQLLFVSGGPVRTMAPRLVSLDDGGLELQREREFILVHAGPDELPRELADRWLRTPGVARILAPTGESAGAWMAPADRGWLILPEPGWRMSADSAGQEGDPVLLGFGPAWSRVWPDAVHDWRVALTVLAANGLRCDTPYDQPLAGIPELRS